MQTRNSQEITEEAEANQFAMCLLMPEDFVRREVKKMGGNFDIEDTKSAKQLADKFKVSLPIMMIRLGQIYHL